jgi:menaquinone-dependent protoporphyrinogen oxidase
MKALDRDSAALPDAPRRQVAGGGTTSAHVLVAYATKHGSTGEVAEAVADALRTDGHDVELSAAAEVRTVDGYDAVVLGGAIYTGRLHRDAARFLKRHRHALEAKPLAVFALGPKSLDAADVASSRAQLDSALARFPELAPVAVAIFGGVLDPAQHRFPLNHLPASDARDWDAIRAWGVDVGVRFASGVGAAPA